MFTWVPPAVVPEVGLTTKTDGGPYANWSEELLAEVPPGVVTATSTTLAELIGGLVAVIEVDEVTVTAGLATPPNDTLEPVTKFVPVMVTAVPPLTGPALGLVAETVGGASYAN